MPEFEISIAVADRDGGDDAGEALRSLRDWIVLDEDLAGAVRTGWATGGPAVPGRMGGGLFDVLQLAIGSSLSAGALAVSILQWRDARRKPATLRLRRGDLELEVPAGGPYDAAAVRALTALLAADPTAAAAAPAAPAASESSADEHPA
ncbi:effector-associated constant component EACC1 [Streptomyces sp. TLI_171]|uniref:effector-associated constant component EACC1 n=1 Tax=Streptomyces sp. TLI_171 TaxID=1938859 RepID=UPI000C19A5CD|nr:hypothetical protein [Streptomyces sp. TLI_171]RKE22351.1 hypothetical protein BX266_5794 [Streptomyces sp. TLI_171]